MKLATLGLTAAVYMGISGCSVQDDESTSANREPPAESLGDVQDEESTLTLTQGAVAPPLYTRDFVLRNKTTGENGLWYMIGPEHKMRAPEVNVQLDVALPRLPLNWMSQAVGDFDGDGVDDLVWRDSATRLTGFWSMSLENEAPRKFVPFEPHIDDPNWRICGAGDFNRDGKTDLVWFNKDGGGQTAIWIMNGHSLAQAPVVLPAVGSSWRLMGVGDLNKDGHPDLVWRNEVSGDNAVWFMGGDKGLTPRLEFTEKVGPSPWSIEAVADIDSDGYADLIWRDTTTGGMRIWFMRGSKIEAARDIPAPPAAWQLVGTRKREIRGITVAATRNAQSFQGRGIQTFTLVPAPVGETTYVLFSGSEGARFYTSLALPASGRPVATDDVEAILTSHAFRSVISTRYAELSYSDSFAILGDASSALEAALPGLTGEGGPSLNKWGNCDRYWIAAVGSGVALVKAIKFCVSAVAVPLVCGLTPLQPLCAAVTPKTLALCAAGLAGAACATNWASSDLACCAGEDITKWPIPTSCVLTTEPKTCSCEAKHKGAHLEVRSRFPAPEYRCVVGGSYKYLLLENVKGVSQPSYSYGSPPGYEVNEGLKEYDCGPFDRAPQITLSSVIWAPPRPGYSTCDLPHYVSTPGSAKGALDGRERVIDAPYCVGYESDKHVEYYAANGFSSRNTQAKKICQGFDSPDGEYRKCAAPFKAHYGPGKLIERRSVTPNDLCLPFQN
jgi:hypothetical protein